MQHLYYIAVLCSAEIDQQIHQYKIRMKNNYGCQVALRSPAHITLIPPFKMDDSVLPALIRDLEIFTRNKQSFRVEIDGFSSFPPRVIYANVKAQPQLEELKKSLELFLLQQSQIPVKVEKRPFKPHVTIANRDIPAESFESAWSLFKNKTIKAAFDAEDISLLIYKPSGWMVFRSFPLEATVRNI